MKFSARISSPHHPHSRRSCTELDGHASRRRKADSFSNLDTRKHRRNSPQHCCCSAQHRPFTAVGGFLRAPNKRRNMWPVFNLLRIPFLRSACLRRRGLHALRPNCRIVVATTPERRRGMWERNDRTYVRILRNADTTRRNWIWVEL